MTLAGTFHLSELPSWERGYHRACLMVGCSPCPGRTGPPCHHVHCRALCPLPGSLPFVMHFVVPFVLHIALPRCPALCRAYLLCLAMPALFWKDSCSQGCSVLSHPCCLDPLGAVPGVGAASELELSIAWLSCHLFVERVVLHQAWRGSCVLELQFSASDANLRNLGFPLSYLHPASPFGDVFHCCCCC